MRVLFLVHQYFPRFIGGTELVVQGLARRLKKRGGEPGVVTYVESPSQNPADFGPRRTEHEGIPVWEIFFNLSCDPHPARAEYDNPLIAEWIAEIAGEFQPDIVHAAHLMKLGASVVPRLKRDGFPVVILLTDYWSLCMRHTLLRWDNLVCETGPDHPLRCLRCAQETHGFALHGEREAAGAPPSPPDEEPPLERDLRALAARTDTLREAMLCADRLVALSNFQRTELVRHGFPADRILVCPTGVEPSEVAPRREVPPLLPQRGKQVVFIGTLVQQKGAHILLEALRRVPDAAVTVEIIGGPGPDANYTTRLHAEAAADPRVIMRGKVPPEGIREALSRADVLALPSLGYENSPLVVKNALASGVPVALADIGTLSEMVDAASGWKLPWGDVAAWAHWLDALSAATSLPTPEGRTVGTADHFAETLFHLSAPLARDGRRRTVHLMDSLDHAAVQAPTPGHVQAQTFVIHRTSRSTVFAHPPSRIDWPEIAVGPQARLETHLAIKPSVWDRIGAPLQFRILLRNEHGGNRLLFKRTLDPRGTSEDRAWVPVTIALNNPDATTVRLTFETSGPTGGIAYGWGGWGDPRITFATQKKSPRAPALPKPQKPDIFLITCDALRADHLGCYGAPINRTPHLDALAATGFHVPQARAQSDTTLGSYVSMLTGLLPQDTGVIAEWGSLPDALKTLPERFAEAGWHTIFAPSEDELADPAVGVGARFAETIPCLGNPAQGAELTVRRLIERLRHRDDRPLFVWLHLFDPHPPAMPPPDFARRFWQGDPTLPYREDRVRAIHAIESSLDLAASGRSFSRGLVPPHLLIRLEETVRAMTGQIGKGPDLASHLTALGPAAWNGLPRERFLAWLAAQVLHCRSQEGRATPELLAWLRKLAHRLAHSEADLLGWLDGVKDIRYPKALYAGSVAHVDFQIGTLVRELHSAGRFDSSLIAFTAPHGEMLDEKPLIFEHHVPTEIVLNVPLILKPPVGAVLPARSFDRLDLIDLGGVLLQAAGLPHEAYQWPAPWRDATRTASVALGMQAASACIRQGAFKLVRFHLPEMSWPYLPQSDTSPEGPRLLLFGGADKPDETRDISAAHPEETRALAAELERRIPEAQARHCGIAGGKAAAASRTLSGTNEASVIIVNHNGRNHMAACLQSLRHTHGVAFEVIVVDNASTDGSPDAIERDFPWVRVLRPGRNAGFGAANQYGVDASTGQFLVFLNSDTVVEPGWLEALVRVMADPSIASACSTLVLLREPHLYNARGTTMWRFGHARERDYRREIATAQEAPAVWDTIAPTGAAMLIRRTDFESQGGFDPAMFMYHEDVDLGWRLRLAGRRVVAVADSLVLHHGSATTLRFRTNRWKHRMGHRHLVRCLIKCFEGQNLRPALHWHFRNLIRQKDLGMLISVGAWNLWHLPSLLRERTRIQRERRIPDKVLFEQGLIEADTRAPLARTTNFIHKLPPDERTIPTHTLLPGQLSAQGRLGAGWHRADFLEGESLCWTNGEAHCRLSIQPNETGRLWVDLALAQEALTERKVVVTGNGHSGCCEPDSSWRRMTVPVTADSAGHLAITISSPAWCPAKVESGSTDTRTLGCLVRRIWFEPDAPQTVWQPRTATVVLTLQNDLTRLKKTLRALAAQADGSFDVLIGSDGSQGAGEKVLESWRGEFADRFTLTLLRYQSVGPGRNEMLAHAPGAVVIFVGADAVPEPGFVAAHLTTHREAGEPCVVLGKTRSETPRRAGPFLRWIAIQPPLPKDPFERIDLTLSRMDDSNLSISRVLFETERFEEQFSEAGWEMIELCYRLSARGVPIFPSSHAAVLRAQPARIGAWLQRRETLGRQQRLLEKLHPELKTALPEGIPPRHALWEAINRLGLPLPERVWRSTGEAAYAAGFWAPTEPTSGQGRRSNS